MNKQELIQGMREILKEQRRLNQRAACMVTDYLAAHPEGISVTRQGEDERGYTGSGVTVNDLVIEILIGGAAIQDRLEGRSIAHGGHRYDGSLSKKVRRATGHLI